MRPDHRTAAPAAPDEEPNPGLAPWAYWLGMGAIVVLGAPALILFVILLFAAITA